MKKIIPILALFALLSCESTPEVSYCEEIFLNQPEYGYDYYGNVSFKGYKKVSNGYLHWDNNKECPHQNGYYFRVLKSTPSKILKSDRCEHCKYTWSLHDDC